MYGLINRAIHELVASELGEAAWERIKARARVEEDVFLSMQTYPDAITVSLVAAAAAEQGSSPADVLQRFGEYWVGYAARNGYGDLLRARGESLFAFIARLDELHSRLSLVFPQLRPPSFRAELLDERRMRLHYVSERDGLAPFVVGLIRGLAVQFGQSVRIEHAARRADGHPHEEFLVQVA